MGAHAPNPAREAVAGLVTLAVLLGASVAAASLARVSWEQPLIYRVGFRVNQDATDVKPGTPVTLGGLQWGKVTRVQHGVVPAGGTTEDAAAAALRGATRGTLVTFELDPRIRLMPGARISRMATLLGSGVELVITDTGLTRGTMDLLPLKGRDALGENMVIRAASPPDSTTTLLGSSAATRLRNLRARARLLGEMLSLDVSNTAPQDPPADEPKLEPAPGAPWKDRFETARATWNRLKALFDEPTPGRSTLGGDLARISNELNPAAKETWAAMQDLQSKATAAWDSRVPGLKERAAVEWDRLKALWARVQPTGADGLDAFHDVMSNSSLAGGQITKLFDEPVRGILLYFFGRPDAAGLDRVARYEAASRLAIATADLREANDALQWLAEANRKVDPAVADMLRAKAVRAVEGFHAAIERLVKLSQQP